MKIPLLFLLASACLPACSSIPSPKMVVAASVEKQQVQALGKKVGAVADVLTVTGEEHYFVIAPAADGILGGHSVDPVSAGLLPDQDFSEPFENVAVVYYVEQPKRRNAAIAGYQERRLIPSKPAYPNLAPPGNRERRLSCDALAVELARAEAIRWFARNQGAMGYTAEQAALRHVTNAAEYAGVAALVLVVAAAGGLPHVNFSSPPPPDPNRALAAQIGEQNLRWAVTAADSRIIGLLKLRRDKACAARPTLISGNSDLHNLVVLEGLHQDMHEQTRLLDELGPLPLPEATNRHCGVLFRCPVRWQSPRHSVGD